MTRPLNVLIIMSDQHNLAYLGCAGHAQIQTPNLDRLAREGVRFTNAYSPSPLCGPARMSFLTGLYPQHSGVYANAQILPTDIPTFAHAFGGAGYDTALIGRMHLNGEDLKHGFEENLLDDVCGSTIGGGYQPNTEGIPCGGQPEGLHLSGPGDTAYHHYDDEVTATTIEWLQNRKQTSAPFMATVGFALPHNPYVCSAEDYAQYDGKVTPPPFNAEDLNPLLKKKCDAQNEGVTDEDRARALAGYCGSVTATDRRIGQILDALDASGLAENTLVIYTSDHGDAAGEHGLWNKCTMVEGSIGVPLIARLPGRIPANETRDQIVNLIDIAPTVLDFAEIEPLPQIDGRSFRCLLEDENAVWDNVTYAEYGTRWAESILMRMVRRDTWKYIWYDGSGESLFNLKEDPDEMKDLASDQEYAGICAQLREEAFADWDPKEISAWLDLWKERNSVLFDWFKSRERPDANLYSGPAGCNRLDAIPEWKPVPPRPWDEAIGSY